MQSKISISGKKKSKLKTNKEEKTKVYFCHAICKYCCLVWKEGRFFLVAQKCLYPLICWEFVLPFLSSLRSIAQKAPVLCQSSCFLPGLQVHHYPLFPHSIEPGCFGTGNFPFAHRCLGECCCTVMFSGILRTCPQCLHLPHFTSTLILVHPVLSLRSPVDTT